jgi:hypothetical protein
MTLRITMNALTQSILIDSVDSSVTTIPTYSISSLMHMIYRYSGASTEKQVSAFHKEPYSIDSGVFTQTNTAEFPKTYVRPHLDTMTYDWSKFTCDYVEGNHIRLKLDTVFSSEWENPFPTVSRAPFTNMDGTVVETDVMCFTEEEVAAIERENGDESENDPFVCHKYKSSTVLKCPFVNGVEVEFILPDVGMDVVRDYTTIMTDMTSYEHFHFLKATRVSIPKLHHTTVFSVSEFMKRTGQYNTLWNTDGKSDFFSKLLIDPKHYVKLESFDYKATLVMDEKGSAFETELEMDASVSRGGGPTFQSYIPFDVNRPYLIRFLYRGTELLLTAVKSV